MARASELPRYRIPAPILLILATWLGTAAAARAQATGDFEELVLQVSFNEHVTDDAMMVLRDGQGGFWIDASDLERLRLRAPAAATRAHLGQNYFPLSGFQQAQLRYEAPQARLHVRLSPESFQPLRVSAPEREFQGPQTAATGMFLNYRLHGQHVSSGVSGGSFTEMGLFSRLGVLTSTTVSRHGGGQSRLKRLETSLRHDFTQRMQTLTLGDAISDPGSFGSALRFAGVQLEKNFDIRPELITAPLLTAGGTALVPSAVDVFVNDRRVLSEQVQPGPFVIDNLPAVTGAGDLRVVVRDAAGQEQVLVQQFYSSPQLLARGLSQYSASLGAVRRDYAFESFGYGRLAGAGTLRRGLNDRVTIEGHGEFLSGDAWGLGSQLAARLGNLGIANVTLAGGGGGGDSGVLMGAGFERQSRQGSAGVHVSLASDGFRRVGESSDPAARQKLRAGLQVGWQFGKFGGTTLALVRQSMQDGTAFSNLSLMHGMRAGSDGYVNLSLNRSVSGRSSTSAFLVFTRSFNGKRTLSVGAEGGSGAAGPREQLRATVTQSTPVGEGYGWRVGAARDGSYDLWGQKRFTAAEVDLQATRNFGQDGQMGQLRGGFSWLGDKVRPARAVNGSFAVVELGGIANVPVYLENRLVAHTDATGRAVLPNLLSYHANRVSIEPEDLPLNASIGASSMLVRPAYRSGVVVKFPVARISPAVFRLFLDGGAAVPVGATVRLNGGQFQVAMDGYTYVTTLDHGVGGIAEWPGGRCSFRVEPPPADDPLPDMGSIECRPLLEATR
jgi:outer membrane usher protein